MQGQLEPLQERVPGGGGQHHRRGTDPQKAQEKIQALRDFIVTQATKSVGGAEGWRGGRRGDPGGDP